VSTKRYRWHVNQDGVQSSLTTPMAQREGGSVLPDPPKKQKWNALATYADDLLNPEAGLPKSVRMERLLRWSTHLESLLTAEFHQHRGDGRTETPLNATATTGLDDVENGPAAVSAAVEASAVKAQRALLELQTCLSAQKQRHEQQPRQAAAALELKKRRSRKVELGLRVATGWGIAALATAWILSEDAVHGVGLFLLVAAAQLEFWKAAMVASGGQAGRMSSSDSSLSSGGGGGGGSRAPALATITATAGFFWTAFQVGAPLHSACVPAATAAVVTWFLLARETPPSISEVSACLASMSYIGFQTSFWLKLRVAVNAHFHASAAAAAMAQKFTMISPGAIYMWWTCFAVVMSDVAAYFGGKKCGRTKLAVLGRGAAGVTSPNKTVEGAVFGCLASALVGVAGALAMKWPSPVLLGSGFGALVAFFGLLGDLTASMFKRDAGIKDFGSLFPGHGGLLDRLDSYIFVGPMAFVFVTNFVLPRL